ncbi:phage tail sheath subtilisin-like domain-containing protein [Kaistia dalseonensis]|uniref:Phage tail sheath gpL-like n=1 Tax=Kaistia dalseonensis TaxID=410840 RepID=A0ABU0HDP2_9HYPH|nr:phage tail sheath subtilisin-like domain-containing protein [Kaistia dalseonensis]MCX5497326.1 phage tail sheath subtilisin-like domain-containing protein [Kaistia dalseonensis]MDQ0439963.1 phage tail sheath gpL-like [Kaistia dalseonensis]
MVAFNEIPYDWLKPGVLVEVRPNYDRMGAVPYPARALLIVQSLAGGAGVAKTLYRITRPDQGRALFGAGSVGADMVEAFKKANKTSDVYAIALADAAAAVAATGTFTFAGTATSSGVAALYIGSVRIAIPIIVGTTAAQAATAAVAAINAIATLPVTAAAAAGVVTLTAKHKGEVGNGIGLAFARRDGDSVIAGLAVTVAAMAAGATNPNLQDVLDVIAAEWFTDIALPWDDATTLGLLAAELATRYQAMGKRDAQAYLGHRGTFGGLTTKGALTNSPFISAIGAKNSPAAPWVWAATLAGVATFQLANDPARQLRTLPLPDIEAPPTADRFTDTEQNLLLGGGISTFTSLADGTVTIDRIVTTYKTSPLGVPDRAWLDIMVPKTASRVRYDWSSYVALMYPRHKLADDDSPAAAERDAVVTPGRMHGSWATRCKLYERWGWIEGASDTVAQSTFARDDSDRNRLNASQQIIIIGNLMVLAAALEFQV